MIHHLAKFLPAADRNQKRISALLASVLLMFVITPTSRAGAFNGGSPYLPNAVAGVSGYDGFDRCSTPTTDQMQAFYTSTPYYNYHVYIGGSNYSCSVTVTQVWISAVTTGVHMTYGLLETWVGPQSSCTTGYNTYISNNTTTAYSQGVSEADSASAAARNLGIQALSHIFYDLEPYTISNQTCRNAVNSFMNGWDYELNVHSSYWAAAYGSSCYSAVQDWGGLANVPTEVWLAWPNGNDDVWTLGSCNTVPSGSWSVDQRSHQYAKDVSDTRNGVTMTIDKDCENTTVDYNTSDDFNDGTEGGSNDPVEDPACGSS